MEVQEQLRHLHLLHEVHSANLSGLSHERRRDQRGGHREGRGQRGQNGQEERSHWRQARFFRRGPGPKLGERLPQHLCEGGGRGRGSPLAQLRKPHERLRPADFAGLPRDLGVEILRRSHCRGQRAHRDLHIWISKDGLRLQGRQNNEGRLRLPLRLPHLRVLQDRVLAQRARAVASVHEFKGSRDQVHQDVVCTRCSHHLSLGQAGEGCHRWPHGTVAHPSAPEVQKALRHEGHLGQPLHWFDEQPLRVFAPDALPGVRPGLHGPQLRRGRLRGVAQRDVRVRESGRALPVHPGLPGQGHCRYGIGSGDVLGGTLHTRAHHHDCRNDRFRHHSW